MLDPFQKQNLVKWKRPLRSDYVEIFSFLQGMHSSIMLDSYKSLLIKGVTLISQTPNCNMSLLK